MCYFKQKKHFEIENTCTSLRIPSALFLMVGEDPHISGIGSESLINLIYLGKIITCTLNHGNGPPVTEAVLMVSSRAAGLPWWLKG